MPKAINNGYRKHRELCAWVKVEMRSWFPGHMERSLRAINTRLFDQQIGAVIEIRDSRAPLSCVNWKFEQIFAEPIYASKNTFKNGWGEPVGSPLNKILRSLVLNKTDLAVGNDWKRSFMEIHKCFADDIPVSFTSKEDTKSVDELLLQLIKRWVNHHRPTMIRYPNSPYPPLNIMVVGLPNTGKSSIINRLRIQGLGRGDHSGGKVAGVGKDPGCTRSLSGYIKIIDTCSREGTPKNETKIMRLLRRNNVRLKVNVMDSPGILMPHLIDREKALRLALINSIPTSAGGKRGFDPLDVAQFLWDKIHGRWQCADRLRKKFGNDAVQNLSSLLRHFIPNCDGRELSVDLYEGAAMKFLRMWRDGELYSDEKDVRCWRTNMVDDEFLDGKESLKRWFSDNYGSLLNDSKVKVGPLTIDKSLMQNSAGRRRDRHRNSL